MIFYTGKRGYTEGETEGSRKDQDTKAIKMSTDG